MPEEDLEAVKSENIVKNTRNLKWKILGMCLLSFVLGVGLCIGVLLFINSTNTTNLQPSADIIKKTGPSISTIPQITTSIVPTVFIPSISIPDLLEKECIGGEYDQQIDSSKTPFVISPSLINNYESLTKFRCWFGSITSENPNPRKRGTLVLYSKTGGIDPHIFIMSSDSVPEGMHIWGYNYDSPENSKDLSDSGDRLMQKDGVTYYLEILSPGPYGITDNGLVFSVTAFKKINNYVISYSKFTSIPFNKDLYDLFEPYKDTKTNNQDLVGSPKNYYNRKSLELKKVFFDKYFSSYETIDPIYKHLLIEAANDLDGITLR